MALVTRRPDLEKEMGYPFVIEYRCTCKKKLFYAGESKPERLEKCFECQEILLWSEERKEAEKAERI